MKKQEGLSLIGALLIIGVLVLTAGGVVVWERRTESTPEPPPTPKSPPATAAPTNLTVTSVPKSGSSHIDKLIYKADKDMCGEIIFAEKLGENFDSALAKIIAQKKEEFTKWCPDSPCQEVIVETKKTQEVRDLSNNFVDVDLYFITVKDKNTGFKVHAISEAIDANGNLYNLNWCPD